MEIALSILSGISMLCAIVFGYAAFNRNKAKDVSDTVRVDIELQSDIKHIRGCVDEIKLEQIEQRKTNTAVSERLTLVEASAKQAHKRIDELTRTIRT